MKVKITTLLIALLVSLSATTMAQTMRITGKVTDSNGDELVGVSINAKETNTGSITGIDGNYSIDAKKNDVLLYTYIGYKTKEVKVEKSEVINVILQEDSHELSEMVVIRCRVQKNKKIELSNSPELLTAKLRYKQPDGDKSVKIEIPVIENKNKNVSSDMIFVSAVAMFGQLMKESDYKGTATYDKVIELAQTGLESDKDGYHREFIRLVEIVKNIN